MYEHYDFRHAAAADLASPQVIQWFESVDRDKSGKISWQELQSALVNAEGQKFSETACRLMIGMFDVDKTGTINLNEFQQLYNYVNGWLVTYKMYEKDQSGSIEEAELTKANVVDMAGGDGKANDKIFLALQQMGWRFSPEFIQVLIQRSDLKNHKTMSVDQFIFTCVQIQRLTEAFRDKDFEKMQGVITIGFEEFLVMALNCSTYCS